MAITVNDVATAIQNSNSTTIAWSHAVSARGQKILVVGVGHRVSTVSSVTYGADALTQAISRQSGVGRSALWYLINPTVDTRTITVTIGGSDRIAAGSLTLGGADQVDPIRGTASAVGSGATDPSVAISSAVDDLVLDHVGINTGDSTVLDSVGGDQTQRWNLQTTNAGGENRIVAALSDEAGASSVTMSWTEGATGTTWSTVAMSVKPGVAGFNQQVVIFASRMREFLDELKRGAISPDLLIERYGDLLTI